MKTGTKIVIGVVITILLLIVSAIVLVVGGFFGLVFIVDQGYKKSNQRIEQAKADGREFGKTTDQNGCMEKGFLRDAKAKGESFYSGVGFVEECLKSSEPISDFCDGVPFDASVTWNNEQCKKIGHSTESCFRAFVAKRGFCNGKKTEQARIDGREFGKTTDQNGCMEKGFSLKATDRYLNEAFVGECLKSSKPIPDFCAGVPTYDDKREVREKWVAEQQSEKCPKYPNNEPCFQTIYGKQNYCSYGTGNIK
jgi:hypothetical protein